jgi:hypothetical protein
MRVYDTILFQAFGGLAGLFAWLSVQPSTGLGWLYAVAAGVILAGVIRKAGLEKEKRTA